MEKNLLGCYQAIEESSRKMLDAAKANDWDAVVSCEGTCAVLIEQLRQRAKTESLGATQRGEKIQIMQRILYNDAQIRNLVEPWLADCERSFEKASYLH